MEHLHLVEMVVQVEVLVLQELLKLLQVEVGEVPMILQEEEV